MTKKSLNPTDKHVGSRVRMRRMMLGLSQSDLAVGLGLTFQQVQKYEKGTNRIGAGRLQQISTILQVPVAFFFEGQPDAALRDEASGGSSSTAFVDDFVATTDGVAIARAFSQISDPKLKRAIAHMVQQIVYTAATAEREAA